MPSARKTWNRMLCHSGGETLRKACRSPFGSCHEASGRQPCETITFDNGKEFAQHQEIGNALGTKVYFSHPHSPWERGTKENTNGLLRQFFPKGKSMTQVSQKDVDAAVRLLNDRPRKCLGWKTPLEAFLEILHQDGQETLHLI